MSLEDDPVFYADARDGLLASAAEKRKKALKHFDYFFERYCKQIGIDAVRAEDIPYTGIPCSSSEEETFKFWDDVMGAFVTYLGKHARAGCKPTAPRIGRNTAAGYCSAVKNYFAADAFRTKTPIPVFQRLPFKKLTDNLQGMFRESNRSAGRVTTEEVSSTRRDREATATACIWMGTPEFAEFWHLSNSSFHCCGRGSETSLIKTEGIIPVEITESVYRYDVIAAQVQRQKNGPFQELPIYPHRDGLLEDFYFSLIHLIVIKGCNHEYVLPQFSKAALKTKKSGESSSDVSRQWSSFLESVRSTFETLADEINEELGSHSNRRGGNQSLAENSSVSGFAAVYRSGIQPKNLATVFDYLFGSSELLRQAGKSLAGWTMKNGEMVMGGQPPTYDDIGDGVETLRTFTDIIFEDDTERRWNPKVRELLVMSLLLRYDQFIDILQKHPFCRLVEMHPSAEPVENHRTTEHSLEIDPDYDPDNRYSCSAVEDNVFVNRINLMLGRVSDGDIMFSRWTKAARRAFVDRNGPSGLPVQILRSYGAEPEGGILMDTRTLIDHFNLLASLAQSNHMELQRQSRILHDLQHAFNVESRITSSFIVDKLFAMEKSLKRIEENLLPPAPEPDPVPSRVPFFSVNLKRLSTSAPLSEVTTAFFADDYRTGYELEIKSPSWGELDMQQRKKLQNKYTQIKRAVRLVLMHADSFPLPSNNHAQYKQDVFAIARKAEEAIRLALRFEPKSTITRSKLEKQPGLRELEMALRLPPNTPDDWCKYFLN